MQHPRRFILVYSGSLQMLAGRNTSRWLFSCLQHLRTTIPAALQLVAACTADISGETTCKYIPGGLDAHSNPCRASPSGEAPVAQCFTCLKHAGAQTYTQHSLPSHLHLRIGAADSVRSHTPEVTPVT